MEKYWFGFFYPCGWYWVPHFLWEEHYYIFFLAYFLDAVCLVFSFVWYLHINGIYSVATISCSHHNFCSTSLLIVRVDFVKVEVIKASQSWPMERCIFLFVVLKIWYFLASGGKWSNGRSPVWEHFIFFLSGSSMLICCFLLVWWCCGICWNKYIVRMLQSRLWHLSLLAGSYFRLKYY